MNFSFKFLRYLVIFCLGFSVNLLIIKWLNQEEDSEKLRELSFYLDSNAFSLKAHEQQSLKDWGLKNFNAKNYSSEQLIQISDAIKKLDQRIKFMSFNILFDIFDGKSEEEYKWPQRLPRIVKTINDWDPDIIGLQEPQINQIADLKNILGDTYNFIDISSSMKKLDEKNNFADAILFKKDRINLKKEQVLFGSNTPEIPSIHPRGKYPAPIHMAEFEDKKLNRKFHVINTHFDFGSPDVRDLMARIICSYAPKENLVVLGDLNLFSNRPADKLPFLDGDHVMRVFKDSCALVDTKDRALFGSFGPKATYSNSYKSPKKAFSGMGIPGNYLDRIISHESATVLVHRVIGKKSSEQFFASDHFALYSEIIF